MQTPELINYLKYCAEHGYCSACMRADLPKGGSKACVDELLALSADVLQAQMERITALEVELKEERYRHDRYVDFELDEAQELAKVKAELDKLRWIPVEERLPDEEFWAHQKRFEDEDLEVQVMIKGAHRATTLLYNAEGDFHEQEGDGETAYIVTHWRPMPEPPEVSK